MRIKKHIAAFILVISMLFSMGATANAADIRYAGLREALDAIPLEPRNTGIPEIDDYLGQLLALITTPEMDTHDRLKACYDYLITSISYGLPENYWDFVFTYGSYGHGYSALMTGMGVCDDYSSAFSMMANRIGVPVVVVNGQTHTTSGGFTPHAWCELDMGNGTVYIFDPQVEDAIAGRQGGKISYLRFGGTTVQLADKYIWETRAAQEEIPGRQMEMSEDILYNQFQILSEKAAGHFNARTGIAPQYIGVDYYGGDVAVIYFCGMMDGQLVDYDVYFIDITTGTGYTLLGENVDLSAVS